MKRKALALTVAIFISSLLFTSVAEAQPEPPNVSTLGPPVFYNRFKSTSVVMILYPENVSSCVNPVQLSFTVAADGFFGQFGNVGVSLDGGVINSVTNFISKSAEELDYPLYWYRTTVKANVMLPTLSEGTHNATVYYGWQYLGINQRYEVDAQRTVQFNIDESPPTISRLSISNKTYNSENITLSFDVNENTSWAAYNLDNQGNVTVQGNVTLTGLSDGSHSIVVYANDTLGNMGESDTVSFTIDTLKAPTVEFFTLAMVLISTALIVVGIVLLVYFKKRKKESEDKT
jgi:hypothetical protein